MPQLTDYPKKAKCPWCRSNNLEPSVEIWKNKNGKIRYSKAFVSQAYLIADSSGKSDGVICLDCKRGSGWQWFWNFQFRMFNIRDISEKDN